MVRAPSGAFVRIPWNMVQYNIMTEVSTDDIRNNTFKWRTGLVPTVAALALAVSGCGSDSNERNDNRTPGRREPRLACDGIDYYEASRGSVDRFRVKASIGDEPLESFELKVTYEEQDEQVVKTVKVRNNLAALTLPRDVYQVFSSVSKPGFESDSCREITYPYRELE